MKLFFMLLCLSIIVGVALCGLYIKRKKMDTWIRSYLYGLIRQANVSEGEVIDILFLFVDHFELNGHEDRLQAWVEGYPAIAAEHKDADGCSPKHTFFYAMDLMHEHELVALKPVIDAGYGEFELHWHHANDDAASLIASIHAAMRIFHRHGYMLPYEADKLACFGFIHGNWSLDNALGAEFCGVDNEIQLLSGLGCYADFTFPALFSAAQPSQINSIAYTQDDGKPKCYDKKLRPAKVGEAATSDEFMVFQGSLTINWRDWRHAWHPKIEDGDINTQNSHADRKRIDAWIRQAIHVEGQPQWQFVKIFCHGAQDYRSVVSSVTDRMFSYLESKYNDGSNYRLHYVSAREAYNIVKAAEDGKSGNPNEYRNYVIPHPGERQTI